MPHTHTQFGEHDHTVSAYIFRTDFSEPKLLLHMHKKLRRYIHFGGHIETMETPWQAIVHELREETGYDISQLQILQPKERVASVEGAVLHPVPVYHNTHAFKDDAHFHTDIAYVFIANEEPLYEILEGESNDVILVDRQELVTLPAEQTFESVRGPALFAFDTCLPKWERVDTATFEQ